MGQVYRKRAGLDGEQERGESRMRAPYIFVFAAVLEVTETAAVFLCWG